MKLYNRQFAARDYYALLTMYNRMLPYAMIKKQKTQINSTLFRIVVDDCGFVVLLNHNRVYSTHINNSRKLYYKNPFRPKKEMEKEFDYCSKTYMYKFPSEMVIKRLKIKLGMRVKPNPFKMH